MARKDLLKNLLDAQKAKQAEVTAPAEAPEDPPRIDPARPRRGTGAIGAVSQSIADLKSRSIHDIPTDLIDPGGFEDRLSAEDGIEELSASIQEYGQQVPVLLRPHPEAEGRYQVVYGRRRVAAVRRFDGTVKAMLRDLDDLGLALAQGQENAARKDLSFIEKANFAKQLTEAGFERKIICDALHIDKTVISRMLTVVSAVPQQWIRAIGAAPGIGRDRWLALADKLTTYGGTEDTLEFTDQTLGSDARFERALASFDAPKPPAPPKKTAGAQDQDQRRLLDEDGRELGRARRSGNRMTLSLSRAKSKGFDEWLVDNLPEIHRNYLESKRKMDGE